MTEDKLYKNKDWLHEQYIIQKKSMLEIAEMCDGGCPDYWLKKFSIPIRSLSEAQKGRRQSEEIKRKMSNSNKILLIND